MEQQRDLTIRLKLPALAAALVGVEDEAPGVIAFEQNHPHAGPSVGIYRGEIIENQAIGVDWVARLGNKLTDPFVLREEIRERIASVPDVISVVGSQIVTDENRRGSVRFRFRDAFSTSSVDGETVI